MKNLEEIRAAIVEAMELVAQAQELVDDAVDGTELENEYVAYGRFGFDRLLGNGNPYDSSLKSLLEKFTDEV